MLKRKFDMPIRRGEVYFVDLEPTIGHEIRKPRRSVVVSNNIINSKSPVPIVCPITKAEGKRKEIFRVFVPKGIAGLTEDSVIHCAQIKAIDYTRIGKKVGELPDSIMEQVDESLQYVLFFQDD